RVDEVNRGLTKQRNYGIELLNNNIDIVCFLDDDTILDKDYFKNILNVFQTQPDAIGIGGVARNENRWKKLAPELKLNPRKYYVLDGYYIKESSRNVLRNYLGLQSPSPPGIMPPFSHGRTYSYPLNNKLYEVDLLIGMAMNFRRQLFNKERFSTYFEGYGLYEDADFCLRARKYGKNYLLTSAILDHYHEASGRPNSFKYGKMVVRNGWYVWRVKYPKPGLSNRLKWNATSFLLTLIRYSNALTGPKRKQALSEAWGRTIGWWSLLFNKPRSR
ncbi:MAG: glycosyltransferase, partial [Flavobacterium sp.]